MVVVADDDLVRHAPTRELRSMGGQTARVTAETFARRRS
jgi:hypothetical protein